MLLTSAVFGVVEVGARVEPLAGLDLVERELGHKAKTSGRMKRTWWPQAAEGNSGVRVQPGIEGGDARTSSGQLGERLASSAQRRTGGAVRRGRNVSGRTCSVPVATS
jgi:hypothetical protein